MADYSVEVIEEPDLDSPAFALFREKTERQFVVGEGVLLVRKDGEPFFYFCVQEHSDIKPIFKEPSKFYPSLWIISLKYTLFQ